jgi:hypothetical protein
MRNVTEKGYSRGISMMYRIVFKIVVVGIVLTAGGGCERASNNVSVKVWSDLYSLTIFIEVESMGEDVLPPGTRSGFSEWLTPYDLDDELGFGAITVAQNGGQKLLKDPWGQPLVVIGTPSAITAIASCGPNRTWNRGMVDDMVCVLDSAVGHGAKQEAARNTEADTHGEDIAVQQEQGSGVFD